MKITLYKPKVYALTSDVRETTFFAFIPIYNRFDYSIIWLEWVTFTFNKASDGANEYMLLTGMRSQKEEPK